MQFFKDEFILTNIRYKFYGIDLNNNFYYIRYPYAYKRNNKLVYYKKAYYPKLHAIKYISSYNELTQYRPPFPSPKYIIYNNLIYYKEPLEGQATYNFITFKDDIWYM